MPPNDPPDNPDQDDNATPRDKSLRDGNTSNPRDRGRRAGDHAPGAHEQWLLAAGWFPYSPQGVDRIITGLRWVRTGMEREELAEIARKAEAAQHERARSIRATAIWGGAIALAVWSLQSA